MISGLNIFLLVTVASLAIYLGQGQDASWYQNEVKTKVAPKFVAAYKTLNEDLIMTLVNVDLNTLNNEATGTTAVSTLARRLNCGIKNMRNSLSEARSEQGRITDKLTGEISALMSSVSSYEEQVRASEGRVQALTNEVRNAEQQVNDANKAVEDRQNDVNAAEGELDKLRNCFGKRFRRMIWPQRVWRRFPPGFCQLVLRLKINPLTDRKNNAQNMLNDARNRRDAMVNNLNNVRQQLANSQNELQSAQNQLNAQRSQLQSLQEQQKIISSVDQEMKNTQLVIESAFQQATGLQTILAKLIDFAEIISPIQKIMKVMVENGLLVGAPLSGYIRDSDAHVAKFMVQLLESKLNNFPLNVEQNIACYA